MLHHFLYSVGTSKVTLFFPLGLCAMIVIYFASTYYKSFSTLLVFSYYFRHHLLISLMMDMDLAHWSFISGHPFFRCIKIMPLFLDSFY